MTWSVFLKEGKRKGKFTSGLAQFSVGSLPQNDLHVPCIQTMELGYIGDCNEQQKILWACHIHATAGHMEEKKTIAWVSEHFVWTGVVKVVKQMV